MTTKKKTYEEAMRRLEEIVKKVETDGLDIDSLGEHLKEAKELVEKAMRKLKRCWKKRNNSFFNWKLFLKGVLLLKISN